MTTIQGDGFTVTIIKSKRRKTMALKVDNKGVSAHIPSTLPLATTQAFINQRTSWIQKKLAQQQQRTVQEKQFEDGEVFLLLGENYTLRLFQSDEKALVKKTTSTIEFYGRLNKLSKPAIRATIIDWYKQQADGYLTARTNWLSDVTSLQPISITIKSYKARWGSCSIKGEINFNWQLIQAPQDVIDYVITHELCHLTHHNHSPKFWFLVEQFMPDYKRHRQWLKNNGHKLAL
ncbi:MAG: M48 family metallopeptidase [Methylophaga sp.]|nr:M48 family metallopeptidase [Methylophaga sp.]